MLIVTNKHSVNDLKTWADRDYFYQLYWRQHKKQILTKVSKSLSLIEKFYELNPDCYACISWGKDSTVLAYLINKTGLNIPCVQTTCKETNPENELVKTYFLDHFNINYHEVYCDEKIDRLSFAQSEITRFFANTTKQFGDKKILGIRGDESSIRQFQKQKFKGITKTSCHPLIYWTLDDIFAYLMANKLPIHSAYGYSKGGLYQLKQIRVDTLGDVRGRSHGGRQEWEKTYYHNELLEMNIYD